MNKRNLIATLTAIATFTTVSLIRKGIRKMRNEANQPRYNVDDYVKITGQPTIYRIDHVEVVADHTVYHLEGTPETSLYAEDVLEAVVNGFNTDEVDNGEYIIPLFDVGETVQIEGCPEVYRIVGAFPEMIYALEDLHTHEIIDMDECVLKAFDGDVSTENTQKQTEVAEMAKGERKLTPREESSREATRLKQAKKQKAADIDNLLDIAIWNRRKYEETGDEAFAEKEREQYAKITEMGDC